ncbi:hypothetical protein CO009_01895 [Candidatus Shapirobacteria bacterium CG_4_8_14_3_um_filter_35_11]|uniref:Uncharacterized protein n=6 Tax=Candidatus Shapironibacteriota TaxID=1752721 RepID=A0A1J5I624_9BACT|nr:MAG: hypothetical protein AUK05_03175 [Candidatus Shapirobacteria bacterium CG2_30_35_20]PIV07256.1 MAG: hypothetical protein COS53_02765 [Candidatus Shapirobacteria bacterium CG03_land_8_20_14_0_80_35_14]PIX67812.1 MAG: hypothetical protein COZ41_03030 [Candidatus Shapirobacteria bacterium CG_4_10_14_3_um_filter_35_13]PJA50890.1 MAG: hypothetical protein CO168_02715 [Candidatus Shapirobacteria bacterium CG_4_9_14_3_um_filter_36_12]PJC80429.1 MAG: hypothetical protein CO009_01895 [Candidatus
MSTSEYSVFVEDFAQRHYIHSFAKKYKGKQWDITLKAIREMLSRYDNFVNANISTSSKIDFICHCNGYSIVKVDFKIAGSNVSAKSSGNRVVAAVDTVKKIIKILLVYSKNDISPPNETAKWKNMVTDYYPEFSNLKK